MQLKIKKTVTETVNVDLPRYSFFTNEMEIIKVTNFGEELLIEGIWGNEKKGVFMYRRYKQEQIVGIMQLRQVEEIEFNEMIEIGKRFITNTTDFKQKETKENNLDSELNKTKSQQLYLP